MYDFIHWFLDGWAGAYMNRQGYYSAVLDTAKSKMEAYEWACWMDGKPATQGIKCQTALCSRRSEPSVTGQL